MKRFFLILLGMFMSATMLTDADTTRFRLLMNRPRQLGAKF